MWSCYMKSPCGAGREAILSGWSAPAPAVKLPEGVSFSVGTGTGIATVVLQVGRSVRWAPLQVPVARNERPRSPQQIRP